MRNLGGKNIACIITEVEAYDGLEDKASHASKGKTARNEPMFGSSGIFYIYLCYGMYWMLNIVTGPKDYPAAILIRGVEGVSGPGKLTKHFHIDKRLNALRASPKAGLWFEDRGIIIIKNTIKKTPRVGVAYAGAVWSKKPYRFLIQDY